MNEKLLQAVIDNKIEEVKIYLKQGGDADYRIKEDQLINDWGISKGSALLTIASGLGHMGIIVEIIKYGVDVNIQNKYGRTALMWAAWNEHMETCKFLIENGADVNLQEDLGETALMYSVGDGYIVRYLLSVGANPLLEDKVGRTAYDLARTGEIKQIIKAFENLWKRWGEKQTLLLVQNINTAIRECSPDKMHSIIVNL